MTKHTIRAARSGELIFLLYFVLLANMLVFVVDGSGEKCESEFYPVSCSCSFCEV